MSAVESLTDEEFARIATIVEELEAENDRLRAENEALKLRVRDLEFNIGWRDGHNEPRAYGLGAGGLLR